MSRVFASPALALAMLLLLLLPLPALAQSVAGPSDQPVAPAMGIEEVQTPAGLPRLTVTGRRGNVAHMLPTVQQGRLLAPVHNTLYFGGDPPLVYHAGGPVMLPNLTIYNIFWLPPTLQDGSPTSMAGNYQGLMNRLGQDYAGHGIANNNTQYFQTIGTTTTYIKSGGSFGGNYVDTSPYPASGCTDTATPGDCITDVQIQAEISKVLGIKGWTGGLNHIFMLYTSLGEGSCFDSGSTQCAYTFYCAYHSFISGTPDIIYANMPYGNLTNCQVQGEPSPNNNPVADAALTAASHEITEAVTDPLLNAWFTANLGFEIGDLCAYDYGRPNTWDAGKANQSWNGHNYLLQTEFDNHAYTFTNGCVQIGPAGAVADTGR